ncbi:MAG: GNAT family N-acetyltransferase [Muribaculaceae bacterium]|nr:GNAT family N-acetyltransferase [Muribaculaceae bacterium]
MTESCDIDVLVANESHIGYVDEILDTINKAAKVRGTGIAKRSPEYVKQKMVEQKAVIALCGDVFAGFSYIESWSNKKFVANSGLIVAPQFRNRGLAKRIKQRIFKLSRERFPEAKIFSLTTGGAVMKINNDLGFRPVVFADLTNDEAFWKGCESCVNFDILQRNDRRMCLCTGLLYDPDEHDGE